MTEEIKQDSVDDLIIHIVDSPGKKIKGWIKEMGHMEITCEGADSC